MQKSKQVAITTNNFSIISSNHGPLSVSNTATAELRASSIGFFDAEVLSFTSQASVGNEQCPSSPRTKISKRSKIARHSSPE
jgi:hypothetical protein